MEDCDNTVEEMNEHNYFSYLNLKKAGSTLEPPDKVVTVRRTRRVLYSYVQEESSNSTCEYKGEDKFSKCGRRSKDIRSKKRKKKTLHNENGKSDTNSNIKIEQIDVESETSCSGKFTKKRRKLSECTSKQALGNELIMEAHSGQKMERDNFKKEGSLKRPLNNPDQMNIMNRRYIIDTNLPHKKRKRFKWFSPNTGVSSDIETSGSAKLNRKKDIESDYISYDYLPDSPQALVIDETEYLEKDSEMSDSCSPILVSCQNESESCDSTEKFHNDNLTSSPEILYGNIKFSKREPSDGKVDVNYLNKMVNLPIDYHSKQNIFEMEDKLTHEELHINLTQSEKYTKEPNVKHILHKPNVRLGFENILEPDVPEIIDITCESKTNKSVLDIKKHSSEPEDREELHPIENLASSEIVNKELTKHILHKPKVKSDFENIAERGVAEIIDITSREHEEILVISDDEEIDFNEDLNRVKVSVGYSGENMKKLILNPALVSRKDHQRKQVLILRKNCSPEISDCEKRIPEKRHKNSDDVNHNVGDDDQIIEISDDEEDFSHDKKIVIPPTKRGSDGAKRNIKYIIKKPNYFSDRCVVDKNIKKHTAENYQVTKKLIETDVHQTNQNGKFILSNSKTDHEGNVKDVENIVKLPLAYNVNSNRNAKDKKEILEFKNHSPTFYNVKRIPKDFQIVKKLTKRGSDQANQNAKQICYEPEDMSDLEEGNVKDVRKIVKNSFNGENFQDSLDNREASLRNNAKNAILDMEKLSPTFCHKKQRPDKPTGSSGVAERSVNDGREYIGEQIQESIGNSEDNLKSDEVLEIEKHSPTFYLRKEMPQNFQIMKKLTKRGSDHMNRNVKYIISKPANITDHEERNVEDLNIGKSYLEYSGEQIQKSIENSPKTPEKNVLSMKKHSPTLYHKTEIPKNFQVLKKTTKKNSDQINRNVRYIISKPTHIIDHGERNVKGVSNIGKHSLKCSGEQIQISEENREDSSKTHEKAEVRDMEKHSPTLYHEKQIPKNFLITKRLTIRSSDQINETVRYIISKPINTTDQEERNVESVRNIGKRSLEHSSDPIHEEKVLGSKKRSPTLYHRKQIPKNFQITKKLTLRGSDHTNRNERYIFSEPKDITSDHEKRNVNDVRIVVKPSLEYIQESIEDNLKTHEKDGEKHSPTHNGTEIPKNFQITKKLTLRGSDQTNQSERYIFSERKDIRDHEKRNGNDVRNIVKPLEHIGKHIQESIENHEDNLKPHENEEVFGAEKHSPTQHGREIPINFQITKKLTKRSGDQINRNVRYIISKPTKINDYEERNVEDVNNIGKRSLEYTGEIQKSLEDISKTQNEEVLVSKKLSPTFYNVKHMSENSQIMKKLTEMNRNIRYIISKPTNIIDHEERNEQIQESIENCEDSSKTHDKEVLDLEKHSLTLYHGTEIPKNFQITKKLTPRGSDQTNQNERYIFSEPKDISDHDKRNVNDVRIIVKPSLEHIGKHVQESIENCEDSSKTHSSTLKQMSSNSQITKKLTKTGSDQIKRNIRYIISEPIDITDHEERNVKDVCDIEKSSLKFSGVPMQESIEIRDDGLKSEEDVLDEENHSSKLYHGTEIPKNFQITEKLTLRGSDQTDHIFSEPKDISDHEKRNVNDVRNIVKPLDHIGKHIHESIQNHEENLKINEKDEVLDAKKHSPKLFLGKQMPENFPIMKKLSKWRSDHMNRIETCIFSEPDREERNVVKSFKIPVNVSTEDHEKVIFDAKKHIGASPEYQFTKTPTERNSNDRDEIIRCTSSEPDEIPKINNKKEGFVEDRQNDMKLSLQYNSENLQESIKNPTRMNSKQHEKYEDYFNINCCSPQFLDHEEVITTDFQFTDKLTCGKNSEPIPTEIGIDVEPKNVEVQYIREILQEEINNIKKHSSELEEIPEDSQIIDGEKNENSNFISERTENLQDLSEKMEVKGDEENVKEPMISNIEEIPAENKSVELGVVNHSNIEDAEKSIFCTTEKSDECPFSNDLQEELSLLRKHILDERDEIPEYSIEKKSVENGFIKDVTESRSKLVQVTPEDIDEAYNRRNVGWKRRKYSYKTEITKVADPKYIPSNFLNRKKEYQSIDLADCIKSWSNDKLEEPPEDAHSDVIPLAQVETIMYSEHDFIFDKIMRIESMQFDNEVDSQKKVHMETRNLSGLVVKQEDPSDDSFWDADLNVNNLEARAEPEIEVVHYKAVDISCEDTRTERKYCDSCGAGYMNEIMFEKHVLRCNKQPDDVKKDPYTIFHCELCSIGITDEVSFKKHERKCRKKVSSKENDKRPPTPKEKTSVKLKTDRKSYNCPKCNYRTFNPGYLNMHRRIHDKIPFCVCGVCQRGFSRLDSLKTHMFRHIDVADEVIETDKVKILNGNVFRSNLKVKIADKNLTFTKYACSKCDYKTSVLDNMDQHFKTMHLNISSFECHLCGFKTKVKSNLKQHLNWHLREKTYKCSYCPYETVNKSYIKKHENQKHLRTVSFNCEHCDFKTYTKGNLTIHINNAHLKSRKFTCDKCSYFTFMQSNLIGHIRHVHEGHKRKKPTK